MTSAFTGGLSVTMSNGASPEVYSEIEEVKSLSGLGKTNPLIDTTSHDSTAKEYIAGLADGSELTIECLRVHTASNKQDALVANVDAGSTVNFRVTVTDASVSPNLTKTYSFAGVCLSWNVTPSFDDANMIGFTVKISGAITVA